MNPGRGRTLNAHLISPERSWDDRADVVECLAAVARSGGHKATIREDWIELAEGFTVRPQVVEFQPMEGGAVRTVSTIQVHHSSLGPDGTFEYQHSTGETLEASFSSGFKTWIETDLPVFLDAARTQPEWCTSIEFQDGAGTRRRLLLGPVSYMVERPEASPPEDHPFCPCCLFTNCREAFQSHVEARGFFGIRLFVLRSGDGKAEADCRINGIDWEPGMQALVRYAESWPLRGYESRKQYVAILAAR